MSAPQRTRTYASLQIGRGLAALGVVMFHTAAALGSPEAFALPRLSSWLAFGSVGVEFFFVLSGFIITAAHWRDSSTPTQLQGYLTKRFIRIYPLYWLISCGVALAALIMGQQADSISLAPRVLVRSLLLLPPLQSCDTPLILAVAWTLVYEVFFYFLFSLFIINRSVGGAALIALLALKGVAWIGAAPPSPLLSFVTADEVLLFFMGMTAARIVDRIPLSPFPCWLLLTIGAGIIATPFVAAGHAEAALNRTLLCGMGSSMLIMGLVSLERSGAVRFSNGPLRLLGDGSYALYLIHYPLISLVVKMLVAIGMGGSGLIGLALSATIAVASSVLCSILLHRRFERPLMSALGRRLGVKRSVQNRLPA